jgi:hypothetical protein
MSKLQTTPATLDSGGASASPAPSQIARPARIAAAADAAVRAVGHDEWERLAGGFPDHNYRQCWAYAEAMAARVGGATEHLCVASGDRTLGLASVRVKGIPGTGTGIAYVSGGPLVRGGDEDAPSRLEAVLSALAGEYVHRRGLLLRVAPTIGDERWNLEQDQCFLSAGFTPAERQPRYSTILVDISRPASEIRAGLAKKWRYHLGRAEKAGISVVQGSAPELFEQFLPLFDEFVARKSFAVELGADFYARVQSALPEAERMHLAIASVGDEPVAGVVAGLLGDTAVYLLGASNEVGREANAPYLLQWKVIEAAADRGIGWYDLGGIDEEANPGVYRFKARMGGTEMTAPGPYELAPGRVRAAVVHSAERLVRAARARRR